MRKRTSECGSVAGYQFHWRRGEPACEACKSAMNEYQKARRPKVRHEPMACLECGTTFTPQRSDNRGFCTPNCSVKYHQKELRRAGGTHGERPCDYCEAMFVAKHRDTLVCSTECRNALKPFRQRGLHPSDYRAMLDAQGHACAICVTLLGKTRRDRHIDHDHVTGKVRGVLCPTCNLMLGHSQDSPEILRAGAEYLEHHHHS